MSNSPHWCISLCASLALCNVATASFSIPVATDVYGVAQGGVVNGVPTANDDNDAGPDINDVINLIEGTTLPRNVDADPRFVAVDDVWSDAGVTVALVGLSAGFTNTLGIYTDLGVGSVQTPLITGTGFGFTGDGSAANPFPAMVTGLAPGTSFGWYLSANGVTNYFSEDSLNPGGFDHMMTFALPGAVGKTIYVDTGSGPTAIRLQNPLLVAWEDLPFDQNNGTLGDDDYDDMMFLVDRPAPVPEPASIAVWGLLSLGAMVGSVFLARRRNSS